jgi:hypothetical protein
MTNPAAAAAAAAAQGGQATSAAPPATFWCNRWTRSFVRWQPRWTWPRLKPKRRGRSGPRQAWLSRGRRRAPLWSWKWSFCPLCCAPCVCASCCASAPAAAAAAARGGSACRRSCWRCWPPWTRRGRRLEWPLMRPAAQMRSARRTRLARGALGDLAGRSVIIRLLMAEAAATQRSSLAMNGAALRQRGAGAVRGAWHRLVARAATQWRGRRWALSQTADAVRVPAVVGTAG